MLVATFASDSTGSRFVNLDISVEVWGAALAAIAALLLIDILILHRVPKVPTVRRAALETMSWLLVGASFGLVVLATWGAKAGGEWFSGYLIEYSLSIDNVFVWAIILSHFKVPSNYQHRVLFWGVFGALVMRAGFIFAGIALVNRFEITLVLFGVFLLYTAVKLVLGGEDESNPADSKFMALVHRLVPSTDNLDGQKLFTRENGKRLATPLFAVLVLVELTDVLFAVDSVPAVLAVSGEQFIVFTSNAFAIMGLRSLYFLLADMRARFSYLQEGLAIILAFVGVKMILTFFDVHIETWISLLVIALVMLASVGFSLRDTRDDTISISEEMPPADER
ncbi:MAG: TerC family protein [Actinomycetia bacterium]|nr:TerC family protein [Actinomycetes bacterium]